MPHCRTSDGARNDRRHAQPPGFPGHRRILRGLERGLNLSALSAWIRAQIDGWQDDGAPGNWPRRLFREHGALLIAGNQAYLWGLTPQGEVLCVDTDDFAQRVERETDPRYVYVALASSAERFPALYDLLPAQPPAGVRRCLGCTGSNCSCGGLGWSV